MNAEIVGKVADVATNAVGALKASPAVLALVILQFLTIGAILYNTVDRQRATTAQFDRISALLDKCLAGHIEN